KNLSAALHSLSKAARSIWRKNASGDRGLSDAVAEFETISFHRDLTRSAATSPVASVSAIAKHAIRSEERKAIAKETVARSRAADAERLRALRDAAIDSLRAPPANVAEFEL